MARSLKLRIHHHLGQKATLQSIDYLGVALSLDVLVFSGTVNKWLLLIRC